jgi:K+/H+ antiporter YhaU regulatory subunit KhtT
LEKIAEYLAAGTVETFYLRPSSAAVGRTIAGLRLRSETGATIVAVVRADRTFSSPGPEFGLEEGDILILSANHRDMDRAFRFLETGKN